MIRGVFDTNLLVSYLLTHRPPIATLIDRRLAGEDIVLVTASGLLEDLNRVLAYPRLQQYCSEAQRKRFVAMVLALGEIVELPESTPRTFHDPGDDVGMLIPVIACAVAGDADVIVSSDDNLLALEHAAGILILSPGQVLETLKHSKRVSGISISSE